jgi:glycerophosphoryl diester phosphodiesterase
VIAHRGASGYRPEHTLEAYRLAIALGADFVEPDLVVTGDGVLVARHDNEIAATTDVGYRPEFADRRTTKNVGSRTVTGWFIEDFTLAELRTLRAREPLPELRQHNQLYDGRFAVPTFDEILDLVTDESRRHGRPIGVCLETKQPTYFASLGLPHEDAMLDALRRRRPELPVLIQSFEPWVLRRLARRTTLPLVQLVDVTGRKHIERAGDTRTHADFLTPNGLREVSTYAQVLGTHKSLLVPRDRNGRLGRPSGLAERARGAGLAVHAWTFRNENAFLPAERRNGDETAAYGDAFGEYAVFSDLGVDAVFTDHPDTAVAAFAQPVAREPQGLLYRSRRRRPSEAIRPASPTETSNTGAATSRPGRPRMS